MQMQIRSRNKYSVDLNTVRDDNRVSTVIGLFGPEMVPQEGEAVVVTDEDGNAYDAVAENAMLDGRVSFRVQWATRRPSGPSVIFEYVGIVTSAHFDAAQTNVVGQPTGQTNLPLNATTESTPDPHLTTSTG